MLDQPKGQLDRLTQSERECLRMVAQHMRSKEIARQRGTSPYTVNRQIESACRKLGASNRQDAARMWLLAEPASGIPNDSPYDPVGIVNPPSSRSLQGATEVTRNDHFNDHTDRDDQLYLEAAGSPAQGVGRESRTILHGPASGFRPGETIPVSRGIPAAQRDHEDGGMRLGSALSEALGQRKLSPRAWLVIFTVSAFIGAILLAGILSAISASMDLVSEISGR